MATEVKRRRGTTAQHQEFIGAEAEITVDIEKYTLLVHDDSGTKPTGHELLRADFSNIPTSVTADVTIVGEVDATKFSGDLTGAIHVQGKNGTGGTLTKGTPVYISGSQGQQFTIAVADADDSAKMPCIGILAADVNANAQGDIVTHGKLIGIDTSSFTVGDELYISDSGTLTATPPTGESDLLQKIAKVIRVHASSGQIYIMGAGRTNAVPNLDQNKIFLGDSNNQAVATALSSIGLTSFNDDSTFLKDADFGSNGLMKRTSEGVYAIITDSSSNWDAAYTYSQVGHLPLTGGTISQNLTISGNLTVSGTTTTVNTETINLADNIITLNSNFTGNNPTENAGIEVERGDLTNKSFFWDETNDRWNADSALVASSFIKQSNSGGFLKADGTEDTSTYLTAHPTISGTRADQDNSGNSFIQDITFDTNGHVLTVSSASASFTDTNFHAINLGTGYSASTKTLTIAMSGTTDVTADLTAIDADKLDGQEGSYYKNYNNLDNKPAVIVDDDFTSAGFMKTDGSGTYSVDGSTFLTSVSSSDVTQHLSVVTQSADAGGELSLVNGEFRFKPAAVSSFITLTDLNAANDTLNTSTSGSLSYSNGTFTFTPPDLSGFLTSLPSHNHNDLYYTETELNAGQLNNLYYTESEVDGFLGNKDNYESWRLTDGSSTYLIKGKNGSATASLAFSGTNDASVSVALIPNTTDQYQVTVDVQTPAGSNYYLNSITGNGNSSALEFDFAGDPQNLASFTHDFSHNHNDIYYTETEVGNFFNGTTSISGYNKSNWDTAFNWGNHASAGYLTAVPSEFLTQTEGDARYLQLSGGTLTGSLTVQSVTAISTNAPKFQLKESDTTDENKEILLSGGDFFIRNLNDDGTVPSNENILKISHEGVVTLLAQGTTTAENLNALFQNSDGVLKRRTLGSNAFNSTTIPTNNNQLTNGAGYITSFDITTQTDPKYLRSDASDTTTGNITISKDSPTLTLVETNTSTGSYPRINFDTGNNQGVSLYHNEFDSELSASGYGLVLDASSSNAQFPSTGTLTFSVLGEIYAGGTSLGSLNKVFHDGYHPNADTLTTSRTITLGGDLTGSASFDGSADITISAQVSNNSHTHDDRYLQLSGGTLTGDLTLGNNSTDRRLRVYHSDNAYTEVRGYGIQFDRAASYIRPTVDNSKTMYFGTDGKTWANINFDATAVAFNKNGSNNLVITSDGDVDISNDLNIDGSFTNTNGNASWRKSGNEYTATWIDDKTVKFVKSASSYAGTTPYGEHQNFIATFSFKTSNATHLGLVYHGQNSPSEDGYNVIIRSSNTVRVQKRQTNVGQSYLIGGVNGTAISGVDIDDGNWHRVTVQVISQKIRVDIDGNQIINGEINDTTFTEGGVGYIAYDGTVEFNNLEVQEIPSTTFIDTLNLNGISEGASNTVALMWDQGKNVTYRTLGSNAFNSDTIPTASDFLPITGGTLTGNLEISNGSPTIAFETGATHYNWQIGAQENVDAAFEISVGSQDANAGDDTFSPKLVVKQSGNVGIGDTTPTAKLDVNGPIRAVGGSFSSGVDTNTGGAYIIPKGKKILVDDGNYLRTLIYQNSSSGNIEIGQTGTALINHISLFTGSSGSINFHTNGGTATATLNSSGDLDLTGRLTVTDNTGGDGSWAGGILIENTSTTTGEPALAFKHAGTNGSGSNYWITGLNQQNRYAIAYGTSFTDANTKLTVKADNKVGIGTVTPDQLLHLQSTSPFLAISHTNDNGTSGILFRRTDNDQNRGTIVYDFANDAMTFRVSTNGTGEDMRIDSSGNVLVGKTALGTAEGFEVRSTGNIVARRASGEVAIFDRKTSDGEIVRLAKDGTTVGSIGVTSGVVSHIVLDPRSNVKGAGILGASIDANTGIIQPCDKTGAVADNAINLGNTSNRWKNFYLGGDANIDGDAFIDGNVGIGTDSPFGNLHIQDTVNTAWSSSLRATNWITTENTSTTSGSYSGIEMLAKGTGNAGAVNLVSVDSGSGSADFVISTRDNGTYGEKVRIDSSGKLGIGTDSPTSKVSITDSATMYAAVDGVLLDIKRNASNGGETTGRVGLRLANNSNGFNIYYGGTTDRLRFVDGSNTEVLSLKNGGNVGIGATNPAQKLVVNGGIHAYGNITTPASGTHGLLMDYYIADSRFWSRGTTGGGTRGGFKFYQLEADGTNQITSFALDTSGNASFGYDVDISNDLIVDGDVTFGSFGNNNSEFAFGQTIANKVFSYGAEFQVTNADIQVVLGRNNGTIVQGTGGIGASSANAFHVYDTTSVTKLFEVAQTTGDTTIAGDLDVEGTITSNNLKLQNLTSNTSDTVVLTIDQSQDVRVRTLGSNAFNSTDYSNASNLTSGTLNADRLPWDTSDGFTGTYPIVWRATNTPYTASWLQVRGSDDSLLTRNIIADGNIDADDATFSGNVLVGHTSAEGDSSGTTLYQNGQTVHKADGAYALELVRSTSDGDIAVFRKDGSTVGTIGVTSGSFAIGQTNTGIGFFNGDRIAFPATSAGAVQDNAIDLGYSSGRWKDLYLGGSVYLGGTGSANALDDYEEGTFTPQIHAGASNPSFNSNNYGKYTKIGNVVHCSGRFSVNSITAGSSSTNVELGGFPFAANTPLGTSTGAVAGSIGFASGFAGEAPTMMQIRDGETNAFLYFQNSSLGISNLKGNDFGTGAHSIVFQITYHV